ncbi:haloacid dehalogenase [Luteitalea sp. TBR-22]|uniref:HAD family hydrolase n=1 Tax=Luteitalea sp. TBR-22 TaxID=2802971 RepID=UPI001AF956BF|nr:HAD family phosphatase [Luteitalea sp. TBR-22]BCS35744.1 haloacid dehalogenase [Luteitalea sp. TBR-22]
MALAAVVFDFDGVLADSEPVHLQVFQVVLDRIGITLSAEEYYAQYLGYSDRDAFVHVLRDRGLSIGEAELEALIETKKELFPEAIGDHALYPGAAECVARVSAHVPVAIASGALRHEIELILDRSGLRPHFPIIVSAGETPRSKPAPDPYARAFELLRERGAIAPGAQPSDVVAIEDSEWGLQSARGAGLRTMGVLTSYTADRLPSAEAIRASIADVTIQDLEDLVAREALA